MSDTTELVARLISLAGECDTFDCARTCKEAADALEQQAAQIEALRADVERLRGACQNARDIIATDRQSFVDCQRLRDTRTESPIEHGLVWVDEDTWVTPDDAEALHDYDRALALIDAALRQEQPNE